MDPDTFWAAMVALSCLFIIVAGVMWIVAFGAP